MEMFSRLAAVATVVTFSAGVVIIGNTSELRAQAANPCAPKSGAAATKPEVDPKLVLRPKGTKLFRGDAAQLVKQGEALFKSTKLSTNEMSCQSCHEANANFAESFSKAYPHDVAMAKAKSGVAKVDLDEMIQFCMVVPMQAKPLRWDSRDLAALTAYTGELQKAFQK
jgi:cytochrome c